VSIFAVTGIDNGYCKGDVSHPQKTTKAAPSTASPTLPTATLPTTTEITTTPGKVRISLTQSFSMLPMT